MNKVDDTKDTKKHFKYLVCKEISNPDFYVNCFITGIRTLTSSNTTVAHI